MAHLGLEENKGDLLEADFGTASNRCSVAADHRFRIVTRRKWSPGQVTFSTMTTSNPTWGNEALVAIFSILTQRVSDWLPSASTTGHSDLRL
jgi:hypothetical protein